MPSARLTLTPSRRHRWCLPVPSAPLESRPRVVWVLLQSLLRPHPTGGERAVRVPEESGAVLPGPGVSLLHQPPRPLRAPPPPPPVTAGGTLVREALQPAPDPRLLPGRRFHPPPLCPLDPERRRYQEFLLHSRWDLSKVTGLSRLEMSSFFLLSSRRRLYNGGRCEATFPAPRTDLIMPGVSRASLSEATLPHRLSQPQGIL